MPEHENLMPIKLDSSTRLLFIGDSITDCGRKQCPEEIGNGYVRQVRDFLLAKSPANAPTVINRGVSGSKVPDLQKRWDRDVIELKPDVLSVFIGINDVWHGLVPGRVGTALDDYIAGYRELLDRTKAAFPAIQLVLCEPSVLWLKEPANADELLEPYVAAVHALAKDFRIEHVVPLHSAFNDARAKRPDVAWTTDGVHPTSIGHALIARAWMTTTGVI